MKFKINRLRLVEELANVSRAISSKATIPVLTGIKLSLNQHELTLIGSDTDISIESILSTDNEKLDLEIERTGSIVLPTRLLNEVVRKLPTDTVEIEVNDQFLATITSGQAVFQINGVDGAQYPLLPDIQTDQRLKLPTMFFKQMVHQTIFAASNQETRPVLTGIHLTFDEHSMTAVATDSHRMGLRQIPLEIPTDFDHSVALNVPKKALLELTRIVEDEQDLYLAISDQQVIFTVDHLTIYSRLIEGAYPDTSRFVPENYTTTITIDAPEFLNAVDRAGLLAHEAKNNNIQLNVEDNTAYLSVQGNEVGHVEEELEAQKIEGEPIKISFNPDYMKDALRAFTPGTVELRLTSAVRPLVLVPVFSTEVPHSQLIQLLTPIRTH